jgi:hypothetical protein
MRQVYTRSFLDARDNLRQRSIEELERFALLCIDHHAADQLYWTYEEILTRRPLNNSSVIKIMNRFPPLVFALLKLFPPAEEAKLSEEVEDITLHIIVNLVRSANDLGIAVLVALEKIAGSVRSLGIEHYCDVLFHASLCVRGPTILQETLLVLNDCRIGHADIAVPSEAMSYAHKQALGIAFDRAEEAADECPCDEQGRPRKQRTVPNRARLLFTENDRDHVTAHIRIDMPTAIRLHSHVRLRSASRVEKGWAPVHVLDGVVRQASKGELKIELLSPPPPETEQIDWNIHNAGSVGE